MLAAIKPECLDTRQFKRWWMQQDNEWKMNNSMYLESTLGECVELYRSNNSMVDIYEEIRVDEELIEILQVMGGYGVDDWKDPYYELDDFRSRSYDILMAIGRENIYWFVRLIEYLPKVEESTVNIEFGEMMKGVLLK